MICNYKMRTKPFTRIGKRMKYRELKDGELFVFYADQWNPNNVWKIMGDDFYSVGEIAGTSIRRYAYAYKHSGLGRHPEWLNNTVEVVG